MLLPKRLEYCCEACRKNLQRRHTPAPLPEHQLHECLQTGCGLLKLEGAPHARSP